MRPMLLFAALLLPGSALAQLQLFEFDGVAENALDGLYQVTATAPGDRTVTRFRLFNTGSGPATLQNLSIAGAGFQITSAPSLPYVVAPTAFAEFKVTFAPTIAGSYSANILVDTITLLIRGTATPAAVLSLGSLALIAGATVDFGKIQLGTSTSQTLTLSNPAASTVTVSSIVVSGAAFAGPGGVAAPLTLAPGQVASFKITFTPPAGQLYKGSLNVDGRSFPLQGLGLTAPLPSASIEVAASTLTSALQTSLSIPLASASQVSGTGTLTMEFHPSVANVTDDPAVLFLSGPPRVATVTIQPGDAAAKFGTSSTIGFQTGTTAGTIVFTLVLPNATQQASLTINPAPVTFDTASGTAEPGSLIISLIGFDNTYSASQLQFTFYDVAGKVLAPGTMNVNVAQNFQAYFQTSQAGGAFALRANFVVSGDSAVVGGVDVQMTNSSGATQTKRLTF